MWETLYSGGISGSIPEIVGSWSTRDAELPHECRRATARGNWFSRNFRFQKRTSSSTFSWQQPHNLEPKRLDLDDLHAQNNQAAQLLDLYDVRVILWQCTTNTRVCSCRGDWQHSEWELPSVQERETQKIIASRIKQTDTLPELQHPRQQGSRMFESAAAHPLV
jgi:hypothetical protein